MKLKLGDARGISMGLPEVMKAKLPVKMSYWFSRTLRELGEHMQDMEKARAKLVDELALKYTKDKKDKNGRLIEEKGKPVNKNNQYQFKDQKKFEAEFKKLSDQEIEIKYNGVTLEELEKLTGEQECPECKKKIPSEVIFKGMDIFNLGVLVLDPDGEKK